MIRDRGPSLTGAFGAVLADAGIRTVLCNVRTLREYETHRNQHAAAPLKPLPGPVEVEQHRVRRQVLDGCTINEYRLAADVGGVFGTHNISS